MAKGRGAVRDGVMRSYAELLQTATGFAPYPYQEDFATRAEMPSLVSVPTGCGYARVVGTV